VVGQQHRASTVVAPPLEQWGVAQATPDSNQVWPATPNERRDANTAAHKVVKLAISQLLDEVWIEECPSILRNVILA
jgi:hypothetical protein